MEPIDLSDFFTTKAEANDFLASLTTISEMFFRTNFNFEKALAQQLGVTKADRFLMVMRENNVNPGSLPMVKEFVSILTQKIMAMPIITLTVAFEPKDQTLKNISEWFVINTKKQLLFDIKIDRSIIAGATITYNGKFSDFSVRETFNGVLKSALRAPDKPASQGVQNTPATAPVNNQSVQQAPQQPITLSPAQQNTNSPAAVPQHTVQQTKN